MKILKDNKIMVVRLPSQGERKLFMLREEDGRFIFKMPPDNRVGSNIIRSKKAEEYLKNHPETK